MKSSKTVSLLCAVVFLSLFAAGCYDVKDEVILAHEAVSIEGLPSKYWTYTITPIANSRDYRFASPAEKDAPAESGYIRAVPLKDNIYIVQVKYDNYQTYILMFFKLITDARGKEIRMAFPDTAIEPAQYGVKIKVNNFYGTTLIGRRKNILAFLKAHEKVSFKDVSADLSAEKILDLKLHTKRDAKQADIDMVDVLGRKLSPQACKELYAEVENQLKNANFCNEDSDCRTLETGGPLIEFGCFHFVNKDVDTSETYKKMTIYSQRCSDIIDLCSPAPLPKCVRKKCVYNEKN